MIRPGHLRPATGGVEDSGQSAQRANPRGIGAPTGTRPRGWQHGRVPCSAWIRRPLRLWRDDEPLLEEMGGSWPRGEDGPIVTPCKAGVKWEEGARAGRSSQIPASHSPMPVLFRELVARRPPPLCGILVFVAPPTAVNRPRIVSNNLFCTVIVTTGGLPTVSSGPLFPSFPLSATGRSSHEPLRSQADRNQPEPKAMQRPFSTLVLLVEVPARPAGATRLVARPSHLVVRQERHAPE